MIERLATAGGQSVRGTERGYPDIEFHGPYFGGGYHAIDVKIAMRKKQGPRAKAPPKMTQSRITLYTGNTYFRFPTVKWPGSFRPFNEYSSHVDVVGLYTLDESRKSRVRDLEGRADRTS